MAQCNVCQQGLCESTGIPDARRRSGWKSRCRPCTNVAYRRGGKAQYMRNGRAKHLRERYGITEDQYAEALTAQQGRCAICGAVPSQKALDVDHDHISGKVRGLLCNNCNRGIGHLKDSSAILRAAADYLDRWGAS